MSLHSIVSSTHMIAPMNILNVAQNLLIVICEYSVCALCSVKKHSPFRVQTVGLLARCTIVVQQVVNGLGQLDPGCFVFFLGFVLFVAYNNGMVGDLSTVGVTIRLRVCTSPRHLLSPLSLAPVTSVSSCNHDNTCTTDTHHSYNCDHDKAVLWPPTPARLPMPSPILRN